MLKMLVENEECYLIIVCVQDGAEIEFWDNISYGFEIF